MPSMRPLAGLGLALVLATTGCGGEPVQRAGDGDQLSVVAAFYPLQFLAERIGGPDVRVTSLASPGAEPHDLELTPRQVVAMEEADLILFQSELQPAVDEAVRGIDVAKLDAGAVTELQEGFVPIEDGAVVVDDTGRDPHVWLDPSRLRAIAAAVGTQLAELRPAAATAIRSRAREVDTALDTLDRELKTGLSGCERRQLVTSHNAFGYLARRYGLQQVGLSGLRPDEEPSPQRLAQVAAYARKHRVTTVFFEELVSPRVAEQLAREVGARTAVLTPLESAPEQGDYFSAMRANLAALRTALGCR